MRRLGLERRQQQQVQMSLQDFTSHTSEPYTSEYDGTTLHSRRGQYLAAGGGDDLN